MGRFLSFPFLSSSPSLSILFSISYKFVRKLPLGQEDLPADAPTALQAYPEGSGDEEGNREAHLDTEDDTEVRA